MNLHPFRRRDDEKPLVNLAGDRSTDPPHKPLKFQVGVMLRKYPVQATLAAAMIVLGIPVWLLIDKGGEMSLAQRDLAAATAELQSVIEDTQRSRAIIASNFCDAINDNAIFANRQTDELGRIITDSVRASRVFDDLYRQYGLPPYSERLKEAQKTVDRLAQRKIPPLNCERYLREIEAETAQARATGRKWGPR